MLLGMDPMQAVFEHPYLWLGPLVLLEGPVATVTAGSLVGAGLARFWPVWVIVVLAEVAGDSLLYLVGRSAGHHRVAALLSRGLQQRLERLRQPSLPRLVITAKLVDILALPAFVWAGQARIPVRRFAAWVTAAAAVRGAVLIGLGALLGSRLDALLRVPGGIFLLIAAVAAPVVIVNLAIRRQHRRNHLRDGVEPCAFSSAPTPTPRTSTAPPPSPSASPRR
jgi:membrane protein DedA with SNARE-associated domain